MKTTKTIRYEIWFTDGTWAFVDLNEDQVKEYQYKSTIRLFKKIG